MKRIGIPPKWIFMTAWGDSQQGMTTKKYEELLTDQQTEPVYIGDRQSGLGWWMYQGQFYFGGTSLTAEQVLALILKRARDEQRRLDRAVRELNAERNPRLARERIPDSVKVLIWQRDEGKCVNCGGNTNLEFDHIIPVSQGGSNSARNLQLLCETCNRAKGGNIT